MDKQDNEQIAEQYLEAAEAWVARLQSQQVSEQDLQQFSLWLQQSEQHQAAYDQTVALWQTMGLVKFLDEQPRQSTPAEALPTAASNDAGPSMPARSEQPARSRRNRRLGLAVAASALMLGFFVNQQLRTADDDNVQHYASAVGQLKSIDLADGSRIELNTNSRVEVRLTAGRRDINLVQGEAYFDVAKDAERPFIVSSCASEAMAVGTEFSVRCSGDEGTVTVTEGIVQVSRHIDSEGRTSQQNVVVGEQVHTDPVIGVTLPEKIDAALSTSWLKGEMVFDNTPLADVVSEANRYSRHPIILGSEQLASLRVSGLFTNNDTKTLISALERSLSLRAEKQDDGSTVLNPAP
ncbi:FecR family protein [Sinobacterium caligoides]|uniref:FecR family protein n=1 Tax=Sinobacterium caligoides TaxID=933926 RepID=A0A3N2DQ93_9GAMM|nr:FecR family protein [Sinobacterium caligoides]ROS01475.1 FecR family protein [Sinobacterium caligoides]